jgi:hypothetical protein
MMARLPIRTILVACALAIAAGSAMAQPLRTLRGVPQKINYQAVARDGSGKIISNKPITIRFTVLGSIQSGAVQSTGPIQYVETHEVTTNQFGLFTVRLGEGTPVAGTFAGIPWNEANQWLRVEVDPLGGNNYIPLGEASLVSVPYALVSARAVDMTLGDLTDVNLGNGASPGQTIIWNGDNWVVGYDTSGLRGVAVTQRLIGNGTVTQPLDIAQQGAKAGQVLKWNGTSWSPSDDNGGAPIYYEAGAGIQISDFPGHIISHGIHTGDVFGQVALTVEGIQNHPVKKVDPNNGEALVWHSSTNEYIPTPVNTTVYTAGNGIAINNGVISHTIWNDGITRTTYTGGNVGIGTSLPDNSALLDLTSNARGFLMPRMTTTDRNAITLPATSLMIYNGTNTRFEYNAGTPASPNWVGFLTTNSPVSFSQITSGVNAGQTLTVGGGSVLAPSAGGIVRSNSLIGAGAGKYAGSITIPNGATDMSVSVPTLAAGAVVILTTTDSDAPGIIATVTAKNPGVGFTAHFSNPYDNPTNSATLDYLVVNP